MATLEKPRPGDAQGREKVERRHRAEWTTHGRLLRKAISEGNGEKVKLAKLVAETLKIRQEAERKVWRLDRPTGQEADDKDGKRHDNVPTRIERVIIARQDREP